MTTNNTDASNTTNEAVAALSGKYPSFYMLRVSFGGLSLFAHEGKHRGAAMGNLYGSRLELYGATNFEKHGGLSWQKGKHEWYSVDPSAIQKMAVWVEEDKNRKKKFDKVDCPFCNREICVYNMRVDTLHHGTSSIPAIRIHKDLALKIQCPGSQKLITDH